MDRAEDTQPSESIHGRPKRILPFVKDTSRGRGMGKGRGAVSSQRGGSGQAANFRLGRSAPFAPGTSRAAPPYVTGSTFSPTPSKPQAAQNNEKGTTGVTECYAKKTATSELFSPSYIPTQPRRKFIPRPQGRPRARDSSATRSNPVKSPDYLGPSSAISSPVGGSPAKRQRLDETLTVKSDSIPVPTTVVHNVSSEGNAGRSGPSSAQVTSGSRFISYERYPKCHFGCGQKRSTVLNNRNSVRGEAVADLRRQGLKIDAVYMRDDGIAIDWSQPTSIQISQPTSSTTSPVTEPKQQHPASEELIPFARFLECEFIPPLEPSPPPRLAPKIAYIPSFQHPTSHESVEIIHQKIPIPLQLLSTPGDSRELERWVAEQIGNLETELGPVTLSPSEIVGIDEHLTVQYSASDAKPYLRIRYRPILATPLNTVNKHPSPQSDIQRAATPPRNERPTLDSSRPLITPSTTYLPQPPSPILRGSTPLIKFEKDELALDPPSPCAALEIGTHDASRLDPTQTHPHTDDPDQQPTSSYKQPEPAFGPTSDVDEIRRLRQDLEASRLEAELKHKELERRILELTKTRMGSGIPEVSSIISYANQVVRVVDESKSAIIVLHKGRHDETRCLLSPAQSTALHISWLGAMQLIDQNTRKVTVSGFEEGAPDGVSVEDACLLSESSVALALAGSGCQLGVANVGKKGFAYRPLPDRPHDIKGICAVTPVSSIEAVTLGHDRSYVRWRFDHDTCFSNLLPIPKLHQCTAVVYEPVAGNIITAGSDYRKRGKLGVYSLHDSQCIPTVIDLSNHVHRIHNEPDNPSLIVLELSRLDDQFQVHDMRLPLYQCVQRFGYQTLAHEKGAFRTRGSMKGHIFSRGDLGIVRAWDRRNLSTYQTISVIPHQKVVDVVLSGTWLACATKSHQVVCYPTV